MYFHAAVHIPSSNRPLCIVVKLQDKLRCSRGHHSLVSQYEKNTLTKFAYSSKIYYHL